MILFLDTANLFYGVKKRHNSRIVYDKFLEETMHLREDTFSEIYVYISDVDGKAKDFIKYFESMDNTILRIKKPELIVVGGDTRTTVNFNVELTLDAARHFGQSCCIASADRCLLPLLKSFLHRPLVHASGIPAEFKNYADVVEISGNLVA